MRTRAQSAFVLVLLLISAAPPEKADQLERRGNAAFDDGHYAQAITYYEQTLDISDEPGRVAFNYGVSSFHLGKYRVAERYFRCALESGGPAARRLRAQYNLGTCLMNVADGKDAGRLAEAISCFNRCLNDAAAPSELLAAARTNLEVAKLLWRRIRTGEAPPSDGSPSDQNDNGQPDEPPENRGADDPGSNRGGPDGSGGRRLVPAQPGPNGSQPIPTSQAPPPGAGHTQSIPDSEQAKPLPPNEARELLRQAEERIIRERRMLQRSAPPGEGKNYPDW